MPDTAYSSRGAKRDSSETDGTYGKPGSTDVAHVCRVERHSGALKRVLRGETRHASATVRVALCPSHQCRARRRRTRPKTTLTRGHNTQNTQLERRTFPALYTRSTERRTITLSASARAASSARAALSAPSLINAYSRRRVNCVRRGAQKRLSSSARDARAAAGEARGGRNAARAPDPRLPPPASAMTPTRVRHAPTPSQRHERPTEARCRMLNPE